MRSIAVFVMCFTFGEQAACAQASLFSNWEIDARADATIALSPGRSDSGSSDAEVGLGQIGGELRVERVLDNGAEIGARLGAKLQFDHPARQGFSGRLGEGVISADLLPRGAFTGLTLGGPLEEDSVEIELETAFVYIDGGYGNLVLGRDVGVARRFHEGAPSVFRLHKGVNASLDTSGIATVLTRNDLTGPSAKVSYATPRILGVQLGASYTPSANTGGVDRDPQSRVPGVAEPRLDNAVEAAINASRRFRKSGIRVSLYGAYGRADVETEPFDVDLGTLDVWSTGGFVEWKDIEFGADWLTTDNAGGRYRAWSLGVGAALFGFNWSGGFGRSEDDLTGIDGETWHFGLSREVFDKITFALGIDQNRLEFADKAADSSFGPVIEITLRL